ncbi:MAG: ATP phosphoribosyltransferase [Clostridium sp.]|nr:ATP phosphoribosyltransferase [Clostridium sp.]
MINVALPKGRLGDRAYEILAIAGFECPAILEKNRKLVFENPEKGVRYFWVKPWDVGVYVERGAADVGICGKDILLENRPDVYELVDLGIGKCRMCVAGPADFYDDGLRTLRVATKFPNIATDYYEKVGRDIDIIKLNGSIEIAPILGLSDVIVDIVETGNTLRENHLAPLETVLGISARFVCNKISFQFKYDEVMRMKNGLEEYVAAREAEKAEGKA